MYSMLIVLRCFLSSQFGVYHGTQGNVIQLTAKSNIAHHFVTHLKEGSVCLLKHFEVIVNREEYHILKDNKMMIQLQGATYLKKQTIPTAATFIRNLFDCIEIEDLVPNNSRYLVGRVMNVGSPEDKRTGSTALDFDLDNERGQKIPVTLWGNLGADFIEKRHAPPALHCIILSLVIVKRNHYGTVSLSSSSTTLIMDDPEILILHGFIEKISSMEVPGDDEYCSPVRHFPLPKEGTLADLLEMTRKGKNNVLDVFKCQVELADIRMKNGWYYTTCSICKSKKGTSRKFRGFWCDSYGKNVPEPITRFRIEFEVRDATVETVVVLFDETAEQLTNTTVQCLLAELDKVKIHFYIVSASFIVTSDSEDGQEKVEAEKDNTADDDA
ncbi:uncharacterized protein [Rutidosis leptorrhynchoides]|uniref:uncharacterized protein n=1 Tax=Rutidosis leptorrhynchoides TaxID=125765 RepID=UPI003A995CDA